MANKYPTTMIQINMKDGKLTKNATRLLNRAVLCSFNEMEAPEVKMKWTVSQSADGPWVTGKSASPERDIVVRMTRRPGDPADRYRLEGIDHSWTIGDSHWARQWEVTPEAELFIADTSGRVARPDSWVYSELDESWCDDEELDESCCDDEELDESYCALEDPDWWDNLMRQEEVTFLDAIRGDLIRMCARHAPMTRVNFCELMQMFTRGFERTLIDQFEKQGTKVMSGHGDPLFKELQLCELGPQPTLVAVLHNGTEVAFPDLTFGQMAYLVDEIL